jgi:general secretion pathway protein C
MTFARLTKPLPIVTLLVVLGVVAASAAPVVWHWRGDFATAPAAHGIIPTAAVAEPLPHADIGPILTLAPFGVPPEEPIADTPIGETTLDLTLLGVVVRSDPALSWALIANAGTSGQYGPGDQITDRATLASVVADHVILDVDGTYQILSFPVPGDANPTQPAVATGTDRLLAAVTAQTAEPVPETTADYIDLWRERIIANPGEVMSAIGLIPTPDGYVIAEQHDSGVELAGLRAGDLVTSVNGQAVGNVERDRQLYDDVAASGMARIEIERDGRTIVMSFPLQ